MKAATLFFKNKPQVIGWYSVAGSKENDGPLKGTFSRVVPDEYFGESTHEGAERKMLKTAITGAIRSAKLKKENIGIIFAGDLLNQIVSSSFALREIGAAFVGVYGACSTMALTAIMASAFIDAGFIDTAVASAGSNWGAAERQYRTPLEFGNQRPPVSQWTVTGTGAVVLQKASRKTQAPNIAVTSATVGRVIDFGIKDVNNMGAAMAPACADTLTAHFTNTKTTPNDYDAIFSGDLGRLGEEVLRDMLKSTYKLDKRYSDCGRLVYDESQRTFMGGSGCGCSAITLNGFIFSKLKSGEYKKILLVATGALLSPTTSMQGETIPCIAHAVVFESAVQNGDK
jgi:stage V sporulation protein AD